MISKGVACGSAGPSMSETPFHNPLQILWSNTVRQEQLKLIKLALTPVRHPD